MYKTQVFVNHEGDLYRTRLTHSLEVAQIARSVARALALNEDLVEAISLAHDLGHTAFGHAGQDALNACMREYGGFEHNLQSLRVVDELEQRYASFRGLNLSFETREGILKHCSIRIARTLGDIGQRFLDRTQPGLEAQIANLADEIAYNNHDVDDRLRAGLISLDQHVAGAHRARALLRQLQLGLFARVHLDRDRLQVQQDVDDVLLDALDARVLVQNAFDLGLHDGSAGHRREQNATQRVAERMTETTLERLDRDARAIGTEGLNLDGPRPQKFRCC
jgi:dGTP triphosphohydrolase